MSKQHSLLLVLKLKPGFDFPGDPFLWLICDPLQVCVGLARVMWEPWWWKGGILCVEEMAVGPVTHPSQERLAFFRFLHPHGGDWYMFKLTCFALIPLLAERTILLVRLLNDPV